MSEANRELVRRAMRETAGWLLARFPDLEVRIEAMVAEGDMVAVWVVSEGANLGPLNGVGRLNGVVAPTGRRLVARQRRWFRVGNGGLAERWAARGDRVAMLRLGVVQSPGRAS